MTLAQITANFARLRAEIDALGRGEPSEARVARLICELDQCDRDLLAFRQLAKSAPTLRDAVPWSDAAARPSRYSTGFGASTL